MTTLTDRLANDPTPRTETFRFRIIEAVHLRISDPTQDNWNKSIRHIADELLVSHAMIERENTLLLERLRAILDSVSSLAFPSARELLAELDKK